MRRKANEIVEEVAPQPGELVLKKAAASAFHGTPLLFHLIHEGFDTVIACGETTSGCVRASVVDGCTYRFHMGVVEECCFDRTQASHWMNLFDMNQKYADVVKKQQAIGYFETVSEKSKVPAVATV
jgi:nicotinamidase-related amidase